MRKYFTVLMLTVLSGCIDADVTMTFQPDETVTVVSDVTMVRQIFDLTRKSPEQACEGGEPTLTKADFRCVTSRTLTLDEFIANSGKLPTDVSGNPGSAATVERLDDHRLKLTFDFAEAMRSRPDAPKPEEMEQFAAMFQAALAGHSLSITVTGPRILDTSGTLSDDGRSASRIIPMTALVGPPEALDPPFVTTVDLEPSCSLLVFC